MAAVVTKGINGILQNIGEIVKSLLAGNHHLENECLPVDKNLHGCKRFLSTEDGNCFHLSSDNTDVLLSNVKPSSKIVIEHLDAQSGTRTPYLTNTRKSNSSQKKKMPERKILYTSDSNLDQHKNEKELPFLQSGEPSETGMNQKTHLSVMFQNQEAAKEIEPLCSSDLQDKQSFPFTDVSLPPNWQRNKKLSKIQSLKDAAKIVSQLANDLIAAEEFPEKRWYKDANVSIDEKCTLMSQSGKVSEPDSGCESSTNLDRYKMLMGKLKLPNIEESNIDQKTSIEMIKSGEFNLQSQVQKEFTALQPKKASTFQDYSKFENILAQVRKLQKKMNVQKRHLIKEAVMMNDLPYWNAREKTSESGQLQTHLQNIAEITPKNISVTEASFKSSNTITESSKFQRYLNFRASQIAKIESGMCPPIRKVSSINKLVNRDLLKDAVDAVRQKYLSSLADLKTEEIKPLNTGDKFSYSTDIRTRVENLVKRMEQDMLERNATKSSERIESETSVGDSNAPILTDVDGSIQNHELEACRKSTEDIKTKDCDNFAEDAIQSVSALKDEPICEESVDCSQNLTANFMATPVTQTPKTLEFDSPDISTSEHGTSECSLVAISASG
ncbi:hypothetical protein CEXT_429271 [Caerostris extrusa]|uniref:Uncharacterized protein n=1 Tax=Caerostris extrusa TaxID=172846 RepID=A0AAV4MU72_CAEEX|nr:hypothetical protein CEXT_429271 [Caerostris extrusa]